MNVRIKAISYYLPQRLEDNSEFKKDNPTWDIAAIEEKTGIKSRHIAAENETALDMAVLAVQKLFHEHSIDKDDVDLLIFVTQSGDYALPTSACIIQDRLNLKKSTAVFDINLGCSGYVYGLGVCSSMIHSGLARNALLICADTYTHYIRKDDRSCRPLFGDGAAATLLASSDNGSIGPFDFGTDGSGYQNLIVYNSGARYSVPPVKELFMNGAKVFMFTLDMVPKSVTALLSKAGMRIDDVDMFIFHQASKVVLENVTRHLAIPENKVFINQKNIGNTVSASIPIALKDAVDNGAIKPGDKVVLVGFGVGYSWGSCLINW